MMTNIGIGKNKFFGQNSRSAQRHKCHWHWSWHCWRYHWRPTALPPNVVAHLGCRRHFFHSNYTTPSYCFVVIFRMQLIILLNISADHSATAAGNFYWPTTTAANNINSNNNFYWSNNNNNVNSFNAGEQQQQQQRQATNGQEGIDTFNTLSSLLIGSAGGFGGGIAPGAAAGIVPIGIMPSSAAASVGTDLSTIFGANFDRNGRINPNDNINNNNFNFAGAFAGQEQETDDDNDEQHQFTRFPTLIPADKVRQLVMATEPTLATAFPPASGEDGTGDIAGEEDQQPVPLGEVRDVSMMRSIPVFGYARRSNTGTEGNFGTFSNGARRGFGTFPTAYVAPIGFGGATTNCLGAIAGGTSDCANNAWHQFGGDANNDGNDGTAVGGTVEAMPSPAMVGTGSGAGSFYVGDGDGGAYEYPLVDEAEAFGGGQWRRHQHGNSFAGFTGGNAVMENGQMPSSSYANFGGFGGGGGGRGEESPEEWEDEMIGGGGAMAMGQGETGGPMPLWTGGGTMTGETTDNGITGANSWRTDSEERQRYNQYLETIQQRYGVVPSAAGRGNNAQSQQQLVGNGQLTEYGLPAQLGTDDGILPQAMVHGGSNSFGDGTPLYRQHRFGGIFGTGGVPLAPMPKASPAPSASFGAGTFPSASLPCAAAADVPSSSPFIGRVSTSGGAMADCAEMAAARGKVQIGSRQSGPVGAGQQKLLTGGGMAWKVGGAVVVPMENNHNSFGGISAAAAVGSVGTGGNGGTDQQQKPQQQQQLETKQALQQRKTVAQVPNFFNGAISGFDGGPFSVAGGGPPWRQHQTTPPQPLMGAQPFAITHQQQPPDANGWRMTAPMMTQTSKRPTEMGRRGGVAATASTYGENSEWLRMNINNGNNLQQQLLEQSLLLALLTTQQQTTTTTPIDRVPTQQMPMPTRQMPMPTMMTTTAEMPVATTTTTTAAITTTTTHDEEVMEEAAQPIQKSTTSIQALSQQIRRLPAVLYADSRKADSRQLELLLRDGYGLPLVTFYADKIGRLAAVEENLAKLTAHRGMPFLFICGTFIGSLEHIKNYHHQKQIPHLVEFVCSGEADKGDSAETAPGAGKALDKEKNNGAETGGKGMGQENSLRRKKKKRKSTEGRGAM